MISLADTSLLLNLIKKTAIEVINTSQPCALQYGTVVSINPLKISLDENGKLVLTENFLVLTRNAKDYEVLVEVNGEERKFLIKNALKGNDKVLLLRMQGGNKYVVLDKV